MKYRGESVNTAIVVQASILAIFFVWLFNDAIWGLVKDWSSDPNYSHGFLIPFVSAYIIWSRRESLSKYRPNPSNWGLIVVAAGLLLYIVGVVGNVSFMMRSAMIVVLFGFSLYFLGARITRCLAVPIGYLLFMIPLPSIIWNRVAFPLQLLAAGMTANAAYLLHLPVLREGNILYLPNTTLEIVDACSGLRSLTSLLALGGACAAISRLGIRRKWMLFLSSVPIAIGVNVFRLTFTAAVAYTIGARAAQGFLHELSGLIIFMLAVALFALVHRLLSGRVGRESVSPTISPS